MRAVITGGAGFIGCNLAGALAQAGHDVVVADNLRRPGSLRNLKWLLDAPSIAEQVTFRSLDVRDLQACEDLFGEFPIDAVAHLAAQVAVTTSLTDPVEDFDVNARGTLNVLEALRRHAPEAIMLFASTNKVYGNLDSLAVQRAATRYTLPDYPNGLAESLPARPVTPYGCSKFAGECYVRDYAHTFGLDTTVFRLSCVYGDHQNGTADQGWVSWFVQSAVRRNKITIYGDGLQVRDLLHVDDLVEACMTVLTARGGAAHVFNVGGGPDFSVSIWAEFSQLLADAVGHDIDVDYGPSRSINVSGSATSERCPTPCAGAPAGRLPRASRTWCNASPAGQNQSHNGARISRE